MIKGMVSIVMAVHNEQERYLRSAITSMFRQTYNKWELIIIDDESDETCQGVLCKLCEGRDNVLIVHNESNQGLTKSLNRGLNLAKGEFIARMDADDISMPKRLEKQVDYLNQHPDIDIVGTGVISFGNENIFMSPAFGYTNDQAQCTLFFSSTLCHPSVMMRKSFLNRHNLMYDENVRKGQDYDMWERCSVYGKLAVMNDVLLFYRTHAKQITNTNRTDQNTSAEMIQRRRLKRLGIEVTDREFQCHKLLSSGANSEISPSEVSSWVCKIIQCNSIAHLADSRQLKKNLNERLTLYKIRNHSRLMSYRPYELMIVLGVMMNRFCMKLKLKKQNIKFKKVLREYEK